MWPQQSTSLGHVMRVEQSTFWLAVTWRASVMWPGVHVKMGTFQLLLKPLTLTLLTFPVNYPLRSQVKSHLRTKASNWGYADRKCEHWSPKYCNLLTLFMFARINKRQSFTTKTIAVTRPRIYFQKWKLFMVFYSISLPLHLMHIDCWQCKYAWWDNQI